MPFVYRKCKETGRNLGSYYSKNKKYEVGYEIFDIEKGRVEVVTRVKFTKLEKINN
jgi:hypothetical protein